MVTTDMTTAPHAATSGGGSMAGKVCVVTGATSGIGKATALALAETGAHVVLVGRDAGRGAAAMREIRSVSGNANVDLLLADLSLQRSVRGLAQEIHDRFPRLDVLVNNAGAIYSKRELSPDKIEMTFAVDHLAYFLLTNLLLDLLKSNAPARIVNVSSAAHGGGHIKFDNLQGEKGYGAYGFTAYSNAKLANILFTYELARQLAGTGVTVNALHPGFVRSGFGKNARGFVKLSMTALSATPFAISPQKGAQTSIHLASSPEVEGVTGTYFVRGKAAKSSRESYDEDIARKLWDVSARMTGLAPLAASA